MEHSLLVGGENVHISGEQVKVVDTTGAGDAFAGTVTTEASRPPAAPRASSGTL